jgi:purine-binding chemotaxis protein CheW
MIDLPPTELRHILLFTMDEPRYALNLSAVERVVQAVEIMPLPKAPPLVLGVINVQGQVIPVVDIRQCFGLPTREINLNDQFILARTAQRRVALLADSVSGIHELKDRELVAVDEVLPGAEFIQGVVKLNDTLVLICDLNQILSFEVEPGLDDTRAANPLGDPA